MKNNSKFGVCGANSRRDCVAPWIDATGTGTAIQKEVEAAVAEYGHCHICPAGFDLGGQPYSFWVVPLPEGDLNGAAFFEAEVGFAPPTYPHD